MEEVAGGRAGYDAALAAALRRGPPAPPPITGTVRLCLLLPLSGSDGRVGTAMQQAALLALFETARHDLELLPYDTAGRGEQASRMARLALADGCALFLGPLLAVDVRTVAPLAAEKGVSVIAFSSDRRIAGDNVFVLGLIPEAQVERVIRFAVGQGRRRLAVLAPDNAYGATVVKTVRRLAPELEITITAVTSYPPTTSDFSDAMRRLAGGNAPSGSVPFDSLLIADGGARLKAIATHLRAFGISAPQVQILGTGLWDEPGIGSEDALIGAWYAAPDPTFRRGFEEAYRAAYGTAPHRLATLAYDGVALAALLAREAQGAISRRALTDPAGFVGGDGLFRLTEDGLADRRLAVLQVAPRQVIVVSPGDTSFAGS